MLVHVKRKRNDQIPYLDHIIKHIASLTWNPDSDLYRVRVWSEFKNLPCRNEDCLMRFLRYELESNFDTDLSWFFEQSGKVYALTVQHLIYDEPFPVFQNMDEMVSITQTYQAFVLILISTCRNIPLLICILSKAKQYQCSDTVSELVMNRLNVLYEQEQRTSIPGRIKMYRWAWKPCDWMFAQMEGFISKNSREFSTLVPISKKCIQSIGYMLVNEADNRESPPSAIVMQYVYKHLYVSDAPLRSGLLSLEKKVCEELVDSQDLETLNDRQAFYTDCRSGLSEVYNNHKCVTQIAVKHFLDELSK